MSEVITPDSAQAAIEAFGDGRGVLVVGGGTVVVPLITYGRLSSPRAVLLAEAGLSYIHQNGSRVTVGATTPLSELRALSAPLGPCAAGVGDGEIQGQATLGGNVCTGTPPEHPAGDLQCALLALGATVRSVGKGAERTEPIEEFLPHRTDRLLLDVSYEEPEAGAFARLHRSHTHHFTALAVSGARAADGTIRVAAVGAGPTAVRLATAEAASDDPLAAGEAALQDAELRDDALASAWYRAKMLPVLVRRVLTELKEAA